MGTLARWWRDWFSARRGGGPSCRACGRCCELYGGHLLSCRTDLERWRSTGREDLVALVGRLGWLWVDPRTGKRFGACPFLVRSDAGGSRCRIHETKPEMCRAYPTLAHGRRCVSGVTFPLRRASGLHPRLFEDPPQQ